MSKQPETIRLVNREAILGEINALLEATGSIDETRAKKVRRAIDALRNVERSPNVSKPAKQFAHYYMIQFSARTDVDVPGLLNCVKGVIDQIQPNLVDLTAVDRLDYIEVVYRLTSITHNHSLVLKTRCYDRENPLVASVVDLWRGADLQVFRPCRRTAGSRPGWSGTSTPRLILSGTTWGDRFTTRQPRRSTTE